MNFISKELFIKDFENKDIRIDHFSERQLEYRYIEYKLFEVLLGYSDRFDFSILGLPKILEIKKNPTKNDYDVYRRNHITLNYELYKIYECGYFGQDSNFITYVIFIINRYKNKKCSIKELTYVIRTQRLVYMNELKILDIK